MFLPTALKLLEISMWWFSSIKFSEFHCWLDASVWTCRDSITKYGSVQQTFSCSVQFCPAKEIYPSLWIVSSWIVVTYWLFMIIEKFVPFAIICRGTKSFDCFLFLFLLLWQFGNWQLLYQLKKQIRWFCMLC